MDERIEKLKNLQTSTLIDVVKNYKKYNYTLEIRDTALKILGERGIKEDTLRLSGNFVNNSYDEAISEYQKYNTNSIIGLILFILSFILFNANGLFGLVIYLAALIFIGLSFANMKKISKLVNDERIDYSVLLVFLSLFVYFIIFFVNRKQIKERIQLNT
ncbi:MAG: hypothetical protein KBA33_08460 [Cloacibacterium sp.]|nr:hypothetical protein [Cloacibacterium sp.]